jgi:hypothetical protein
MAAAKQTAAKAAANNPNLNYYNQLRVAPSTALKSITAGKLKGKSDINPQWRIEILTSTFGPVGIGWYTEIVERWIERENIKVCDKNGNLLLDANRNPITNVESTAWVRLNMYVKVNGEWSKPIQGVGGSKQVGKGQGDGINDEAFKMAETDAISVACKKLGVAADVYWASSTTKYTAYDENPQWGQPAPAPAPQPQPVAQAPVQTQAPAPQPAGKPQINGYTEQQAIDDINAATSAADLANKWGFWKCYFSQNAKVVKAVMDHPMNPNNGRSNG